MTDDPSDDPIEILLVEDNPADVRLTVEVFKQAKLRNVLHIAEDGETALAMLRDPARRRPDLILLDLNLPGIDGREVLQDIKSDPALRAISIIYVNFFFSNTKGIY